MKPANTDPAGEALPTFADLLTEAATVTMDDYGTFLEKVGVQTVAGVLDAIQRGTVISVLADNDAITAGRQLVKAALKKVEGDIRADMAEEPDGICGARGIYTVATDGGVLCSEQTKQGYTTPVKICGALRVLAETYDLAGGNHGRLLEWRDTLGRVKTWPMPAQLVAGDGLEIIRRLLDRGLWLRNGNEKEILDYIMAHPVAGVMTCTEKTGWMNDAFVTPGKIYGAGADKIIFQPLHEVETGQGQCGTLDQWKHNIAKLAVGNSRTMCAISLAFAGTLLDMAGVNGFGIHFHDGSSGGKTKGLLMPASSVWGRPEKSADGSGGYMRQWLATSVGLEGTAYAHNDGFLVLDEIGEATAQTVGSVSYMLANGITKVRGGRDGNAKAPKHFRLVFASTGERTLEGMAKEMGMTVRAGQEVRLIHVPADAGKGLRVYEELHGFKGGAELSEHFHAACGKYYGTAGVAWLDAITQPDGKLADISQSVLATCDNFLPAGASGQVRRVARQFALVAYAGELATRYGITGWVEGQATAAAKVCFDSFLDGFGGADGQRENRMIVDAVRSFLIRHASKFQDLSTSPSSLPVQDRVGFVRQSSPAIHEEDVEEIGNCGKSEYIIPSTELHRLAEGYSREQIIAALRSAGMLNEPDKEGKAAVLMRVMGKLGRYFTISE